MPEEDHHLTAVDLFCGAGGFSEALQQVADDLDCALQHAAVNHWDTAIETHERNHPSAHQYHSKVEQLHPPDVVDALTDDDEDLNVDILVGGPECTHFSRARGGKPVSEQKRMSPWHVLDWLEKLNVDAFVIENVPEIQDWGPVDDGQPVKDGSIFDAWVNALNKLGYSVDWTQLVAADYGDPTSRERFFIIGRQHGQVTWPEPTHSDQQDDLPDYRTAADIIDWSDLGGSIWTRDLDDGRKTPPKNSTMQRIAEGLRRHCDDAVAPFADVLEDLGRDDIRRLREDRIVPHEYAGLVAGVVDEPFLVPAPEPGAGAGAFVLGQHSNSVARDISERPVPTVTTGGKIQLCTSTAHLLRQQDGAHPLDVTESPVPTIATAGAHALATTQLQSLIEPKNGRYRGLHSNPLYPVDAHPHHTVTTDPRSKLVTPSLIRYSHGGASLDVTDPMPTIATERGGVFALSAPYLCPLYNPRPGQRPRTRAVDRPLMTVPASKSPAAVTTPLLEPFIDDYEGPAKFLNQPLGTVTSKDRFALVIPELWPWGLDVRYRMLQPSELKQAQGFPADYDIAGSKTDRTKQIGNAVPVGLAKTLCKHVITAEDPSLGTFGGGISRDPDDEIPSYEEVASDD